MAVLAQLGDVAPLGDASPGPRSSTAHPSARSPDGRAERRGAAAGGRKVSPSPPGLPPLGSSRSAKALKGSPLAGGAGGHHVQRTSSLKSMQAVAAATPQQTKIRVVQLGF